MKMIFDKNEIEYLSDYGDVVDTIDVIKKIEDMMVRNHLSFEPDYYDGNKVKLDVAEELLIEMRKVIKDISQSEF